MRSLIAPLAMPILRFATRSYVTGTEVANAIEVAQAAQAHGFACTLCYWNEASEDPQRVMRRYLETLAALDDAGLDGELAVKIPALWNRCDMVRAVVDAARARKRRVVFDSHAPAQSDVTFEMLHELGAEGLGSAVPGRWKRSIADCDRAARLGLSVRVVKGQWADPEQPDIDLRRGFLDVVECLAGRASRVGVATHDATLAEAALFRLQRANTPCEVELLYGLPIDDVVAVGRRLAVPIRLYVPFGTAWLPYSVSRALENPRVLLWVLRDLMKGRRRSSLARPAPR